MKMCLYDLWGCDGDGDGDVILVFCFDPIQSGFLPLCKGWGMRIYMEEWKYERMQATTWARHYLIWWSECGSGFRVVVTKQGCRQLECGWCARYIQGRGGAGIRWD